MSWCVLIIVKTTTQSVRIIYNDLSEALNIDAIYNPDMPGKSWKTSITISDNVYKITTTYRGYMIYTPDITGKSWNTSITIRDTIRDTHM